MTNRERFNLVIMDPQMKIRNQRAASYLTYLNALRNFKALLYISSYAPAHFMILREQCLQIWALLAVLATLSSALSHVFQVMPNSYIAEIVGISYVWVGSCEGACQRQNVATFYDELPVLPGARSGS